MGDRDDRAAVLVEEALQPFDRFRVEMVRGLVEEQQVRVLEQEPREGDPALLAAREGRDIGVVGRTAQRVHRDLDVPLDIPGVGGVDPVLQRRLLGADRVVVGVRIGPFGHHGVVLVEERLHAGDAVHDVALDVLRGIELRLLAQVADREARCQARVTDEAVVEPRHDPHQA